MLLETGNLHLGFGHWQLAYFNIFDHILVQILKDSLPMNDQLGSYLSAGIQEA